MRDETGTKGGNNVSIEHIMFKNQSIDATVQTSTIIPYRLRFWPKNSIEPRGKQEGLTPGLHCGCTLITQWILSQAGLMVVVCGWAFLGAYVFHITEGPREFEQRDEMDIIQKQLSIDLATDLRVIEGHSDQWPKSIDRVMKKHQDILLKAVSRGFGEGGDDNIWTYPGCLLFAVSLLTTLGFGAPVPRTSPGRGAAVLFSAIGIPLHLLLVFNLGSLGAIKLQQLAASSTDLPPGVGTTKWLKWFPLYAITLYYLGGVGLFGFARSRNVFDSFLFPLDFTAAGGVASVPGYIKLCYGVYLELAVTLAALIVSLLQTSTSRSLVNVGLKFGLLTNT